MGAECSGDTPTLQSRDGRRETPEITRIYKTKRVTRPTTATLPESITAEGKANGRGSSKRRDEEKRERGREGGKEEARARESRLSRGKRRAPTTSSLTAVNGRSLRRNTVRERGRENKRDQARWMKTAARWGRRREDGRAKREREKGDTFITRRRATGKIERQVVFARGSLPGASRGETLAKGLSVARMELARRARGKDGAAYGPGDTRIAVLPRDHFLCKIKYCKYDGSGHIAHVQDVHVRMKR